MCLHRITCLLLGSILTATDTLTVVQAMRKAGVSERLSSIIEGESILVDCLSFILVSLFRDILLTSNSSSLVASYEDPGDIDYGKEVGKFVQEALAGPLFGVAIGLAIVFFLYRVSRSHIDFQQRAAANIDEFVSSSDALLCSCCVLGHQRCAGGNNDADDCLVRRFLCGLAALTNQKFSTPLSFLPNFNSLRPLLLVVCFVVPGTHYLHVNGNLAVVAMALYFSQWERHTISPSVQPALRAVVESLSYVAITLIYAIAGVMAAYYMFVSQTITGTDVGYCIALYLLLHVTRAVAAFLLLPLIRLLGFKLNYKDVLMISYSGIRGVQALVLMLTVVLTPGITDEVSHRIGFQVSGIVLLTNVINAPTARWMFKLLGLKSDSPESRVVLLATIDQLKADGAAKIEQLRASPQFEAAEWPKIQALLQDTCRSAAQVFNQSAADNRTAWQSMKDHATSFRNLSSSLLSPSSRASMSDSADSDAPVNDSASDDVAIHLPPAAQHGTVESAKQRDDLTERFLELQRTEYHRLYDSGCLSRAATVILMKSINESLDRRDLSQQWRVIDKHLKVPGWLSVLYSSSRLRQWWVVRRLVDQQVFLHLAVSLEISSAFCGAETKLRQFLQEFPVLASVNQAAMDDIQREASVYARRAADSFADIRSAFPAIYTSVHSKHAALTVLTSQEATLHHLHDSGLLSEVEYERLHNIVENRYVAMKRQRPENNMAATEDIFSYHPLVSQMQTVQREWLLAHSQRLLLPPNQWVAGGNEADSHTSSSRTQRAAGLYFVVRGQVSVYHEQADVAVAPKRVDGGWAVVHPCPLSDPSAARGNQQRLGVGALLSARSLIDGDTVWCKTVTASELLFVPAVEMKRALTEQGAEAQLMRAAAADILKSAYSHLPAGAKADAVDELVTLATLFSMQTGSSDASNHTTQSASRVLLLIGHLDLKGKGATVAVDAPALVELEGGAALIPSLDARWIEWQAADEQRAAAKAQTKAEKAASESSAAPASIEDGIAQKTLAAGAVQKMSPKRADDTAGNGVYTNGDVELSSL